MNRTRASSLDAFGTRDQRNRIYPALEASDGSTLSLDFTQMSSLDSRFTFTRASTGTYINSQGYVASAGNNVPRFTYDPVTLAPLGLLIEGSANNLLYWSETFGTSGATKNWSFTGSPTLVSTATSPRNDATALRITSTSGAATVLQDMGVAAATRTFSIWVRRVSGTGTINYTLTGTSGWTPFTITSTWTRYVWSGSTNHVGIQITTNGDSIEIWGAQVEDPTQTAGTGASSYIPTTTAQGTRAADNAQLTSLAGINYSTTNGTLMFVGQLTKYNTASYPCRCGFFTAVDQTTFEIFSNNLLMQASARGSSGQPEIFTGTTTLNTQLKFIASFDASLSVGEVRGCLNGGSILTSSASGLTSTYTPTRMQFGKSGYDAYMQSGPIALVKYWPITLSDAQLKSLTL